MQKTILLFALALLLAGLGAPPALRCQEAITLGVVTKPGATQNICAGQFRKLVEKRSPYKVRIYDSGAVGTEVEILRQVKENNLRMAIVTSGPFDTLVPEARVVDYPFLFSNYRQADIVLDGPAGQELLALLEKANLKGLAFAENGFRHLTNNRRPVHRAEDVAGLRIRVMESRMHEALWRTVGASPVPVGSLKDVVKALKAGTVDGQENPVVAIWENQFFKGQKYLTLTGHVYSSHICVANLKWFRGLPDAHQKLIQQSMQEAARYERQWNRKNETGFLGKIRSAGVEVEEQPDMASFRKKASAVRETDVFRGKELHELLGKFMKAAEEAR